LLRFASSPTHDLHITDLRIALFNYIVAKQKNEDFIIRIEDTNKEQNINNKDKEILEILNLFSIEYKNVLHQSDNLKYHSQFAMQLLIEKKAFNCFCGKEVLETEKNEAKKNNKPYIYSGFCENLSNEVTLSCEAPFTVRIKQATSPITFIDSLKGTLSYEQSKLDSSIILKHDKTPTENFACAIDDMLSNISTIIKEEQHLTNTPLQIHIRNSLGYNNDIQYIHIPTLINKTTHKTIAIQNDQYSVQWFINEGFLPVALVNYLLVLGFDTQGEIFSLEESLQWFDINKISKEAAIFDIEKLRLINNEYLKNMDNLRLSKLLTYSDKDIGALAKIYLNKCDTLVELKAIITNIFNDKSTLIGFEKEFKTLKKCIINAPYINNYDDFEQYIKNETQLDGKQLMSPLRYALTGANNGPNLHEIYPYIKNYLGEILK
jgi:glutamyl-tRNA synthetase